MKIYLLDINKDMVKAWKKYFHNEVEVICDEFSHFLDNNDVQCIVSPANSLGIMNGGYDLAITKYFGDQLTKNVQQYIKDNCNGYQDVGTALIFDIPKTNKKLIHTPTMLYPSHIEDVRVIYNCMVSTLNCAKASKIESIVIPAFGGLTGGVSYDTIAKLMYKAYKDINK